VTELGFVPGGHLQSDLIQGLFENFVMVEQIEVVEKTEFGMDVVVVVVVVVGKEVFDFVGIGMFVN